MKRLICAKDVETAQMQGNTMIHIDENTIITPAAMDLAKACSIEFKKETALEATKSCETGLDSELIYNLLKSMMDKGLLNGILDSITSSKPYEAETTSNGLKVIRGKSVKLEALNTSNPNEKVFHQELISKDESSMRAGLLTIDQSQFNRQLTNEGIYHVMEGTLEVTIDGKTLTAYPSDVVYIPSNANVTWTSKDKAKLFYVYHPVN